VINKSAGFVIVRLHVQNSNFFVESSGVPMSGISTFEKVLRSDFPSRAHSALRRTESLSPRLMLSSETERGRLATETPIKSADS
jgi:hypothetical protein